MLYKFRSKKHNSPTLLYICYASFLQMEGVFSNKEKVPVFCYTMAIQSPSLRRSHFTKIANLHKLAIPLLYIISRFSTLLPFLFFCFLYIYSIP